MKCLIVLYLKLCMEVIKSACVVCVFVELFVLMKSIV